MEHNSIVLNLVVLLIYLLMMTSVGLSLEARHFLALSRLKLSIVGLLIAQTIALPVIALLVVSLVPLPPHTKTAVLLLAACPIGDIANFYVVLARANASMAVTLNTLSCALSVVTMPFVFVGYTILLGDNFTYKVPYSTLVIRLLVLNLIPLAVGMIVRHWNLTVANRMLSPFRFLCTLGIFFVVTNMFVFERVRLAAIWRPTLVAAACLLLISTAVGVIVVRLFKLPDIHAFGGSIVFPVRNIGLALAISVALPEGPEYTSFAVIFFLAEVPILLGLVGYQLWFRTPIRNTSKAPAQERALS